MKFSRSLITAILAIASPLLTTSTPIPTGATTIQPTTLSQYEVWTGAVHFNTASGKIFKSGRTTDITTLATFDFPAAAAGKTCELHFALDAASMATGSAAFDIFTSLAPATQSTATWPSGNLRDQYLGRFGAVVGAEAVPVSGFPALGGFPCPEGRLAGELVGTGDVDDVEWVQGSAGPYIVFY